MNKIAIVTHYYKSQNYGGNFQSFALCYLLDKLGHIAEQLSYLYWDDIVQNQKNRDLSGKETLRNLFLNKQYQKLLKYPIYYFPIKIKHAINRLLLKRYKKYLNDVFREKEKSFFTFNQKIIPHSQEVYSSQNIKESITKYDVFITGSDQVWNTTWYTPVFFLDFVPSNKVKFSYAASISKDILNDNEREIFRKSLADFKAVSVREKQAVDLIRELSPVPPQLVLDPTLLLNEEDWNKICAPRITNYDYILCYFLGGNKKERRVAKQIAKKKHLKIVSVPLTSTILYSDLKFGDIILPTASPEEFISLIKYATYVFTDSFHAVVFSYIYKRQYFVFNRDSKGSMNSRILNIIELFNSQDRFCNGKDKENLKYISSLKDIDYNLPNKKFEEMKEKSIRFLKDNLS